MMRLIFIAALAACGQDPQGFHYGDPAEVGPDMSGTFSRPPDGWDVETGTWGTDVYDLPSEWLSGGVGILFEGSSAARIIAEEAIPITQGQPYMLEVGFVGGSLFASPGPLYGGWVAIDKDGGTVSTSYSEMYNDPGDLSGVLNLGTARLPLIYAFGSTVVAVKPLVGKTNSGDYDLVVDRIELLPWFFTARAYLGSNQTITAGAGPTLVQLGSEDYDPFGKFDTSNPQHFTVPRSGYYRLASTVTCTTLSSQNLSSSIYVNSAAVTTGGTVTVAGGAASVASTDAYLEQDDTVSLYASVSGSGSETIFAGSEFTWLSVTEQR